MPIFWNTVGTPTQSGFTDTEFFSYTTEGQPISRAELSKSIMKRVMPEAVFRKYVSKITDFGANQGDHVIIPKKITAPESERWEQVNEFDPLPSGTMGYIRYDIPVFERGKHFPFTERVKLFSNYDIEAEIREQCGQSIVASLERDLLMNAIVYMDVVGVATANDNLTVITGKSLNANRTFGANTTPRAITQVTYNTTNGTIDGATPAPLTMTHVLRFAQALANLNCPSYTGGGFGDYLVIVNAQARNRLLVDPVFYNAVTRFMDKEKIYEGYLGTFFGQEFVEDKGKWIDRLIYPLSSVLNGRAIAIFMGKDAVKEAIVKPEQILPLQKADFGRFMSYAIHTYRGEAPMWFSADGQVAGGILVGA